MITKYKEKFNEIFVNKNAKVYLLASTISGISNFWAPVLVYFQMKELNMTLSQIFIGESIYAFFIFAFEIPTGVVADKYGRKISVIIGKLLWLPGIFLMAIATNYIYIFISQALVGFANTFVSGAEDALLYDSLKEDGYEKKYKKIKGKSKTISYLMSTLASLLGGYIASLYGSRMTIFLTFIFLSINSLVYFLFKEPVIEYKGEEKNYKFLKHINHSLKLSWNNKYFFYLMVAGVIFSFLAKTGFQSLNPYWVLLDVPVVYFGFALSFYNIVSMLFSNYTHKIAKIFGDFHSLILAFGLAVISLVMLYLNKNIYLALLIPAILQMYRSFTPVVIDDLQHKIIDNYNRATMISISSFANQLFIFIFLPIFGIVSESKGLLNTYLYLAIFIMISGFIIYPKLKTIDDIRKNPSKEMDLKTEHKTTN